MKILLRIGVLFMFVINIIIFVLDIIVFSWLIYPIVWVLTGKDCWNPEDYQGDPILFIGSKFIVFTDKLKDRLD